MKKRIFTIMLVVVSLLMCMPVSATENVEGSEWTESFSTDFETGLMNDFYSYFNTYDLADDNNLVEENGNTYYEGRFPKGIKVTHIWDVEEYRVTFDLKTNVADNPAGQNAYKTALIMQHPSATMGFICEPDNGDEDKTSYQGAGGLGVYFWDNTLEIVVSCNKDGGTAGPVNGIGATGVVSKAADRLFGIYGVAYQFVLPEGKTFTDCFRAVDISLRNGVVKVLIDSTLICTVELSDMEEVVTLCNENYWDDNLAGFEIINGEDCYRKAVVKDATGKEVLTVEDAVVPQLGSFGLTNRVNNYQLDNLTFYDPLYTNDAPATPSTSEEPNTTEAATQTPLTTQTPDNTTAPSKGPETKPDGGNILVIVILICVIIAVAAIFVILVVLNKRKKQ